MGKKRAIDPAYYENHDFGDEFEEAARNGTLIVTLPGESALDSIRRFRASKGGGSSAPKASVPVAARGG